ncbi:MAG: hypothetical protein QOC63_1081 [Mycobacterium sp.]|nr:hypothetical protein [Mycobacterium sp.]
MLARLDGRELGVAVDKASQLLATVLGQDIGAGDDGVFRILRRVAPDRVISTVDPETRHGHKTSARGFDGYKGHIAIDPDTEIITATEVTPGNSGDAEIAEELLADILQAEAENGDGDGDGGRVFGDAAYGAGELLKHLDDNGVHNGLKVQPSASVKGHFSKDRFGVDLERETVTCPAGNTAPIRARKGERAVGSAAFGAVCADCPLRAQCTSAAAGRTITIGPHEKTLVTARARQHDPAWKADYRATRPKVERKIGHLMRRRHGGRRARVRGRLKVAADFALLAAATDLARLAVLGVSGAPNRSWTIATA